MSEAAASLAPILSILAVVLGGLCCLLVPVAVVVIIVVLNKKKKAKLEAEQPIEVVAEYPEEDQQ